MVRPTPALDDEGGLSKPARWQVELQVVTPMFGGSATTREVDPDRPIRAASIRGQLRFWWRAIYGRRYASPEELFKAEESIFGSDSVHGQVALSVDIKSTGTVVDYGTGPRPEPELVYAVFPFQENRRERLPWAKGRIDVEFAVNIDVGAAPADEMAAALRAWSTLGGVGARWRRGCGSVAVRSSSVPRLDFPSLANPPANDLAHLPAGLFVGSRARDAEDAWLTAVDLYRHFRQGVGFARNPGTGGRPGRSRYPEADSIRSIRDAYAPIHSPTHPVTGFPRADLGLPIVFHFKDSQSGDPKDQQLQGADKDHHRFVSPVITRALRRSDGRYYPMLMILSAPSVWRFPVELKGPGRGPDPRPVSRAEIELTPAERQQIHPLDTTRGRPIRAALLAHTAEAKWAYTRISEVLT